MKAEVKCLIALPVNLNSLQFCMLYKIINSCTKCCFPGLSKEAQKAFRKFSLNGEMLCFIVVWEYTSAILTVL